MPGFLNKADLYNLFQKFHFLTFLKPVAIVIPSFPYTFSLLVGAFPSAHKLGLIVYNNNKRIKKKKVLLEVLPS